MLEKNKSNLPIEACHATHHVSSLSRTVPSQTRTGEPALRTCTTRSTEPLSGSSDRRFRRNRWRWDDGPWQVDGRKGKRSRSARLNSHPGSLPGTQLFDLGRGHHQGQAARNRGPVEDQDRTALGQAEVAARSGVEDRQLRVRQMTVGTQRWAEHLQLEDAQNSALRGRRKSSPVASKDVDQEAGGQRRVGQANAHVKVFDAGQTERAGSCGKRTRTLGGKNIAHVGRFSEDVPTRIDYEQGDEER